jgi:hypothetical protein
LTVIGIISSWFGQAHLAHRHSIVLEFDSSLNHLSRHSTLADMILVALLEQRALARINAEYPASERDTIRDLLATYTGPEHERVIWDILELSRGDSDKLLHFLHCAQLDYRDILYWAEYYDNDPIKDRDPGRLVNDLLGRLKKGT